MSRFLPKAESERLPPHSTLPTGDWAATHLEPRRFHRELHPARHITRPLPKSIDPEAHWKFRRAHATTIPATFAASIPNARIVGRAGFTVTADGSILQEVSREWFVTPEQHSLFFKLRLPRARRLQGITANLAFVSGHNYYHWLFDVLARIALVEKAGFGPIDQFVTNPAVARFQNETLDALDIPRHKRVATDARTQFVCDELVLPSPQGLPGQTPDWACQFLRDKFLPKAGNGNGPRRVYISRQCSGYRRMLNQAALDALLREREFTTVTLEAISFKEQVRIFSGADVILAPHGAGLANLVFCRPGAKVIEMFAPCYVNECFWSLACQMQLDYYYVIGHGSPPEEFKDPHRVEDHIVVDLDALRTTLKLAGL